MILAGSDRLGFLTASGRLLPDSVNSWSPQSGHRKIGKMASSNFGKQPPVHARKSDVDDHQIAFDQAQPSMRLRRFDRPIAWFLENIADRETN